MGEDELRNGGPAIACQHGKDLVGDGEDSASRRSRNARIEDAGFTRTGMVGLNQGRPVERLQKLRRSLGVVDQPHTGPALAYIRLEDERPAPAVVEEPAQGRLL